MTALKTLGFGLAMASIIATVGCNKQNPDAATGKSKTARPYPLTTCIVSGEDLGSMGGPVTAVHKGQQVQFCCKACLTTFNDDPDGYVAKIAAAAKQATAPKDPHAGHNHGETGHEGHNH